MFQPNKTVFPQSLRSSLVLVLIAPCATRPARPQHASHLPVPPHLVVEQPATVPSNQIDSRSPHDWIVLASNNEIATITHAGSFLRYQTHTIDQKGDRSRVVVETTEGSVARTIAKDGRPLSADEDAAERKRLQEFAASPTESSKHSKGKLAEKKLAVDLVRLLPDAMIWTPAAEQAGARSPSGRPLVAFDYKPNPGWTPPSMSAEVLTGLEGRLWIDAATGNVTRMEGNVFRPVSFAFGILARVNPGGKISIEQTEVGNGRWIFTRFTESIHVRALMLKTVDVSSEVTSSGFETLPGPVNFQQAVALLLR